MSADRFTLKVVRIGSSDGFIPPAWIRQNHAIKAGMEITAEYDGERLILFLGSKKIKLKIPVEIRRIVAIIKQNIREDRKIDQAFLIKKCYYRITEKNKDNFIQALTFLKGTNEICWEDHYVWKATEGYQPAPKPKLPPVSQIKLDDSFDFEIVKKG